MDARERCIERMGRAIKDRWDRERLHSDSDPDFDAEAALDALLASPADLIEAAGGTRQVTRVCNNDGGGGMSVDAEGRTQSWHRTPTYTERVSFVFPTEESA